MRGSVKALIRFIQEKSVVDVVYLVMMILIVTMIKDMIMSMYRKRKDTNWLRGVFNNKQKQVEERFETHSGIINPEETGGQPTMVCPDTITQMSSVCEKLKFLLCDNKFHILKKYIDADWVQISVGTGGTLYRLNTKGGDIYTMGGNIFTNKLATGARHTDNDIPIDYNELHYDPEPLTKGGVISTGGGEIRSHGGNISTRRYTSYVSSKASNAGYIIIGDAALWA
jgi:hypothetical protein